MIHRSESSRSYRRHRGRRLTALVAFGGLVMAACGSEEDDASAGGNGDDECTTRVGGSISLTGQYADQGDGVRRGYDLWVDETNEAGGLLGCEIELTLTDDASDPQKATAIYEDLLSSGDVDLLVGPFSSTMVLPTSQVAEENGMLFVEPFGSAPEVFDRGFQRLFFGGPTVASARSLLVAEHILSLPEEERPRTAAYANMDDPFAASITDPFREALEEAGVETVIHEVYTEQTDFVLTAAKIADTEPDLFFGGTLEADAVELVRALGSQEGFDPEFLIVDAALSSFWDEVGPESAQGVITLLDWGPDLPFPGNEEFLAAYRDAYDEEPDGDFAVHSWEVGQVITAAVEAVGCAEATDDCQGQLAEYIHDNPIDTVFGTLEWDEVGRPSGVGLAGQWIDGSIEVVLSTDPSIETEQIVPWRESV